MSIMVLQESCTVFSGIAFFAFYGKLTVLYICIQNTLEIQKADETACQVNHYELINFRRFCAFMLRHNTICCV